jgi:hypothetical protein
MRLVLTKKFKERLQGRFGKYSFQVGVLNDGPHRDAKRGQRGLGGKDVLGTYAGGPVRKQGRTSKESISQVSKENRERLGLNFYTEPFKRKSSDIIKFTRSFFKLVFGASEKRRAENLLQAVVRNPILRGDYGPNSPRAQKIKGFDRAMIDTAQLFKAIKAKCTVRAGRV